MLNPFNRNLPYLFTIITFALYVAISTAFHDQFGFGVAALAVIPVICGGWYFGIRGGLLVAVISILTNIFLLVITGQPDNASVLDPGNLVRIFVLLLIAVVVGKLSIVMRERHDALLKLEAYEKERETHTKFLELLNTITREALEAKNLESTLKVLVERIGKLFNADDCFFALWDEERDVSIPYVAYGSMSDIYPFMIFEPGERTLSKSLMEARHPIAVPDTENTPFIDRKIAKEYPSRSMLGLPFIVQNRKLGTLLLGYIKSLPFDQDQVTRAGITAEQVAQVLSKSLLLEEERKQVRQLTALHDVALTSTKVDNEDELIERITDIIGKNLFTDNFGILLLEEQAQILRPHPSYRFFSTKEIRANNVRLGEGVTGQVAETRQSQCIGNVRHLKHYLDVDERTVSELCVPILFKDQLLGVINAESTKRNAFNSDDERMLTTLAGQLATAIKQIRRTQAERKWLNQLAHSNDMIYSIAHITTKIERVLTKDEIIQTLGVELGNIGLTYIMATHDMDREEFTINYTSLEPHFLEIVENGLGYPLLNYTFSRNILEHVLNAKGFLRPAVISNPEEEIQILFTGAEKDGVKRILQEIGVAPGIEPLRLPLAIEENLLGILWIWGSGIQKADLPIMSIFAKQVAISLERAQLFKEVQSLALTDPLTGLNNRRSLFEVGKIEFSRSTRMNRPFCCMMLDLDHFKLINDNHGHLIGDQVIQEFAKRCKSAIREIDLIGRYGGEELIIFLPETDLTTAKQIAERIRGHIAGTSMTYSHPEIMATVSIGIAQKDDNSTDLKTLIARADQAMYIAKHKGRNRVAVSV
jgi:diguanylate cyclase (GGDEF)-like protein